jgi:hypothetical protein
MTDTRSPDAPTVGRPTLGAVQEPLARNLSDALYATGQALLELSRTVERREVADYRGQGERVGQAFLRILLLHGQLASLDEAAGGKMHGTARPQFPAPDPAMQAQIEQFRERRDLERTQRRLKPAAVTVDDAGLAPLEPEVNGYEAE